MEARQIRLPPREDNGGELLILCELGCAACRMCLPSPGTRTRCQLPPTLPNYLPLRAKIKAVSFSVIIPTFLPGALGRKGRDWIGFLLSKRFDPIFHIMHHSG